MSVQCQATVLLKMLVLTSEGKKVCSKSKRGHRNGGILPMSTQHLCMSLLVNLVSSSDGNDIGVGLT